MRRFGSTGPDDSKQPLIAQVIADWKTSLGGRVGSVDRIGVLEFPEGCRNSFAAFSAQLAVFSEKAVERSVSRSGGSSAHTATRSRRCRSSRSSAPTTLDDCLSRLAMLEAVLGRESDSRGHAQRALDSALSSETERTRCGHEARSGCSRSLRVTRTRPSRSWHPRWGH